MYNPNILRDVLEARSLSRTTLSQRLGIDVDDLERELKREPEPKQSLLNNIAHELALPAFVFYMKEPPPLHDVILDFRSANPAASAKKRETVEAIQFAAGVQRAVAELEVEPATRLPRIDPAQYGHVEEAAASAREFFKITLEDQLEAKDAKAFYVMCRKRIEDRGIFVLHDSFPDEDGSGFCLADRDYPVILINTKNQNRARRLFTLIHEVGHVLNRQTGISDPFVRKNALERYCNHFAGAFLVPAEFVRPLLKNSPLTDDPDLDDVKWVSRRLKVSQQAAVLRLEQLKHFKAGSHEKWLRLIHNTGNPDWNVKRYNLDVWTALNHPTDQGEVAARGPQTGPRGHVSVLAVEQQNRGDPHSRDHCLGGLIEGFGPRAEVLDSNFRRWAGPFNPAAHGPTVYLEQFRGGSLRQSRRAYGPDRGPPSSSKARRGN